MLLSTALLLMLILFSNGEEFNSPVDLSRPFDKHASVCGGGQNFEFIKHLIVKEPFWAAVNIFKTSEHCGTHIDAPYHFNQDGITVEKIPLDKLLVTAILIDVSKETGDNENYTMPLTAVKDWETVHGPIPENSVVMIRTGWESKYFNKEEYVIKDGVHSYPGLHTEATQYLIDTKKVVGVGMDSPSVDPGYDLKFTSHQMLAKAGLYILENVVYTTQLPPLFKLIVAPMKIAGGTGSPTRLIALPLKYKF